MKELELRDVVKKYLETNGLSVRFMARKTGLNRTTLQQWLNGERDMSTSQLIKVKQFITGDYIVTAEAIAHDLIKDRSSC